MMLRSGALAMLIALAACTAPESNGADPLVNAPTSNAAAEPPMVGSNAVEPPSSAPAATADPADLLPVENQAGYDAVPPVAPLPPGPTPASSCAAEIGAEAAMRLATACRAVSPATRPPCNPANSCDLIRDEITRGCAMLDEAERPATCGGSAEANSSRG